MVAREMDHRAVAVDPATRRRGKTACISTRAFLYLSSGIETRPCKNRNRQAPRSRHSPGPESFQLFGFQLSPACAAREKYLFTIL
jgi:hypothetical protein